MSRSTAPSTPQEMFDLMDRELFPGQDMTRVITMTEEAQRAYMLEQTERLLEHQQGHGIKAAWMGDLFWTCDEGRKPMNHYNPLLDPQKREGMTDPERMRCAFYLTMAGLCHDLYNHYPFDPHLLGLQTDDEDFLITNTVLVEWVESGKYPQISARIAHAMKRETIDAVQPFYQPAQDALAELYDPQYGVVGSGYGKEERPMLLVGAILKRLRLIDHHLQQGFDRGLCLEEIIYHDEIVEGVDDEFCDWALDAAREIYQTVEFVYKQCDFSQLDRGKKYPEQPEPIKQQIDRLAEAVIDKVRDIRTREGITALMQDHGLGLNYMVTHVHMKCYGWYD